MWGESEGGSSIWAGPSPETLVLDESPLDSAVLGTSSAAHHLEQILTVISSGSFPNPGNRDNLTPGEGRQLRDAMILDAHSRVRRDIFVTKDEKGFIRKGRRGALEKLCSTRIMTPNEVR